MALEARARHGVELGVRRGVALAGHVDQVGDADFFRESVRVARRIAGTLRDQGRLRTHPYGVRLGVAV
jgi:hypothetical protein